ncbi:MAG: hypothetical protein JEZ06_23495 [Anaerolineaceae bacterium]|nr:hypothetical protein [Anaerolineaceae bacterium]
MYKTIEFQDTIDKNIISDFKNALQKWGKVSICQFPWRYHTDPYVILVSEFMLHRTQARQVVPVFQDFIHKYPDLETFVQSNPVEVRNDIRSLGLVWRSDGMINALTTIWNKFGQVPLEYGDLCSINGIGPYIAGATLCFSQNKPFTLIDTNVVRVVGRFFGLDLKGEARRRKSMICAINTVVDLNEPRNFYFAIIDLAHTICRPHKPSCESCPLQILPCQFKMECENLSKFKIQ